MNKDKDSKHIDIDADSSSTRMALTIYFPNGETMSISGGSFQFDVTANGTLIVKSENVNLALPPGQWSTVGKKPIKP